MVIKLKDGIIYYKLKVENNQLFNDEILKFLKSKNVDELELNKLSDINLNPIQINHEYFILTIRKKNNEIVLLFETLMGSDSFYNFLGNHFN